MTNLALVWVLVFGASLSLHKGHGAHCAVFPADTFALQFENAWKFVLGRGIA